MEGRSRMLIKIISFRGAAPRLALLSLVAAAAIAAAPVAMAQEGVFLYGRWEGEVDFGQGREELALRLFPSDPEVGAPAGGLVDLPSRGLFGYPIDRLTPSSEGLSFTLLGDSPFDGVVELRGSPVPMESGERFAVTGTARLVPAERNASVAQGPFTLSFSTGASRGLRLGADIRVDTGRGHLPGSLVLPDARAETALPVVLLLSGASADRDGNNYFVPGRSDSMAQLALALGERGIASLRYDKRGSGEAYRLVASEADLRFDDHVADARAAMAALAADSRFSGVTVLGFAEGALVGAAALGSGKAGSAALAGGRISGLVTLCASGKTEVEAVEEALSSTPEELKAEAEAIMAALKRGGRYPAPSPYFADYFRPSAQPYLASLFGYDIRAAFAAAPVAAALAIAGGSDLQVPSLESELLATAREDAAYRVIPGMSHALKAVGEDEEANYASFTDPSLPLAEGLADLVAAFARGASLPGDDPRASDLGLPTLEGFPEGAEGAGEGLP